MATVDAEEFNQQGVIMILDLPQGGEFGIDLNSWIVDSNFKGIKLVPVGVHFVYCSAGNKYGNYSPRSGFWVWISPGDVVVRKWCLVDEVLLGEREGFGERERERFVFGVKRFEFDRFLAPYPFENYDRWKGLSCHVSFGVVDSHRSVSRLLCSDAAVESLKKKEEEERERERKRMEKEEEEEGIEKEKEDTTTSSSTTSSSSTTKNLSHFWTTIPKKMYPKGATPSEITKYSIDKSFILTFLFEKKYQKDWKRILGELEFAFVSFLIGQLYEGFEQWKEMMILLCGCQEALTIYPDLFFDFFEVTREFLNHLPDDFFVDLISRNNFLLSSFDGLFDVVVGDSSSSSSSFSSSSSSSFSQFKFFSSSLRLKSFVESKFGVVFPLALFDQDSEDAPVVVEDFSSLSIS